MRAAFVERLGGPEEIRVGELADLAPAAGEVLVRVRASAVDAVDTFVRSGAYRTPTPFPFVIGRDLVGTVEAVGAGVSGFGVGDPVWCNSLGHGGRQGAAAELALVQEDRLYPLPPGCDPVDTVAMVHPAATAYLALFTHGRGRPGETVLIAGAGGHVGSMAVALAVAAGFHVISTSSAGDCETLLHCGVAAALDYRNPALGREVREAAPGGVDLWLDTSGHNDLELAVELLAHGGRVVVIAGMDSRPVLPLGALYTRDASILGFAISNAAVGDLAGAARHLNPRLADGTLPRLAIETMPLDDAARAHEAVETGATRRRLVLVP